MSNTFRPAALAVAAALLSAGCASYDLGFRTQADVTKARARQIQNEALREMAAVPPNGVVERSGPYSSFKTVKGAARTGTVDLHAAGAPFGPLLHETAKNAGYSAVFTDSVDINRRVTASFNKAQPKDVMRRLALLAGYAVAIDDRTRTISVAAEAVHTFKLPASVFQKLESSYKVGSSGGKAAGGDKTAKVTSIADSSFEVSGKTGVTGEGLIKHIQGVAGSNADVQVSDSGFITVRANGSALERIREFLTEAANDAMMQADIQAVILDVALGDEFSVGLDWTRILKGGDLTLGIQGAGKVATPALSGAFTTADLSTVVKALRDVTDVTVISRPRVVTVNNTGGIFFDSTSLPYLGDVKSTPTSNGSGGSVNQVTGELSFTEDGVFLSVVPSIVDKNQVMLKLVPKQQIFKQFDRFSLGAGQPELVGAQTQTKSSFMEVLALNGKTMILGGLSASTASKANGIGNVNRTKSATETVMLVRASIYSKTDYDPLVRESL